MVGSTPLSHNRPVEARRVNGNPPVVDIGFVVVVGVVCDDAAVVAISRIPPDNLRVGMCGACDESGGRTCRESDLRGGARGAVSHEEDSSVAETKDWGNCKSHSNGVSSLVKTQTVTF